MSILKRISLLCVFLFVAVTVLVAGPVSDYGLLQVKDGKLSAADAKGGMPIQLRGMSLYWSNWGAAWWNESAVDQSVDWLGCQIIRAAMSVGSKDNSNNPTDVDGGYLNKPDTNVAWVKAVVDEAIYKDIYVIIDWHDHAAQTHLDQALAFFIQMAKEYGNRPNVIFEIYNEPITTDWNGTIKPYAETVISAIRATTSDYDGQPARNVIIVGTPFYSQLGAAVVSNPVNPSFTNIAYTLHFYAAEHHYNGGTSGLGKSMMDAINAGLCVVVTEWGTVSADGSGSADQTHSQEWVDAMSANNITWCNWSLNDKDEAASMFTTGTTPLGPWQDADLTASGIMVKAWLPAPTTQLSVCPSLIKFFCMGGSLNTTVTTGSYTEATSDQAWLSVSPTSGSTGQTITITADSYDSTTENRTGNITFTDTAGNQTKVKVVQLLNDGNLALGKNAVASSVEGSYAATNVTDGDEETTRWSSEWSDPQWIYVDLGENTHFNGVSLIWETAYSKHFFIQMAVDGADPNNDASYINIHEGTYDDGLGAIREGTFFRTDYVGRYIRVYSLERTTINGSQYGVSLYEIKVWAARNILVQRSNTPIYAGGLDQKIDVISNVVWTASSSAGWLTIDPVTGGTDYFYSGSHPIIHCEPNYEGVDRTAVLTFTGEDALTKTLTITQPWATDAYSGKDTSGNPVYIRLYAMAWDRVDNPDGSTDATFRYISEDTISGAHQAITVEPQVAWLTVTSTDSEYITVHATPNTTGATRNGIIILRTVSYPCLHPVWVYQDPFVSTITVDPASWSIANGANTSCYSNITSNTGWTVTSTPAWITPSQMSGYAGTSYISYTIDANTDTAYRTGTVTFTCDGSAVTATVSFTQSGAPEQSVWTPSGGGEGQNMTITFSGSYTAESDTSWLSITPPGGDGGTVSFYISASTNTTGSPRTGTITIQGGGVNKEIKVTQDPVSLVVNPKSIYVAGAGGTKSITITSNVIWWSAYTTDGGGWLSINTGSYSGVGNGTVRFTVSRNTTGRPRTATITIIGGDVPTQIVTITQGK